MPIIELPNGESAQFPDSMSREQIKSAIQLKFPPVQSKPMNAQSQEVESPLARAGNYAEKNFNKPIERFVRDPALGFIQGVENIPSNVANLGITGINKLSGSNIPHVPTLDVAPHTLPSEAGNALSFLFGPSALGNISKIPSLGRSLSQVPLLSHLIEGSAKLFKNNPKITNVLGQSILGGAYSPDNPLLGMGLGAAGSSVGPLLQGTNKLLNSSPIQKIISPLISPFKKFNPSEIGKNIQNSHDKLENEAIDIFDTVGKEAVKKSLNIIPNIENLVSKVSKFLPNTAASEKLINNAMSGEYSAIRKLQSDLWHRGTSAKSSVLHSERDVGEEILDLRDKLNQSISDHFMKNGEERLVNLLTSAKKKYAKLKKVYYGDRVPPAIKNLVHEESRKIPKNIINVLSEESLPLQRLKKENPFIENILKDVSQKEKSTKLLNYLKIGVPLTLGGLAGYGINSVRKNSFGTNPYE